jgi:phosphoenolpyruvate carboxykinase (ATP)
MATISKFPWCNINTENKVFSKFRAIIETPFYRNNVSKVTSLKEAYKLAKKSPGTIVTDLPVYKPEKIGLDEESKVLLFNDGSVTGRCAAARRIFGEPNVTEKEYSKKIQDAVFNTRYETMYHAEAYIGLDEDFMVKAHLVVPENYENLLYNWLLNFQCCSEEYVNLYSESKKLECEGDIFIFSDPDWKDPDHPLGLTFFDTEHNCAAILGMKYFGEFKKGTLTLAWGIANRKNYVACHGGMKKYSLEKEKYIISFFGLSGSGKSTLTHNDHKKKFDVTILHDDAFIISTKDGSSIAMEPSYFDKIADYPLNSKDNKYFLSVQNSGATLDEEGKVVLLTEDIRNGNGRAIKSKLWSPNRVNSFEDPVNAVVWLMKDPMLPPIIKIKNAYLAATMGATLATKRTSAERLAPGVDPDSLVIEPYANPFRTYPLKNDFDAFVSLFNLKDVCCYIFNTGYFMDKKVSKDLTLGLLEKLVRDEIIFEKWSSFSDLEIYPVEGFIPDFSDEDYRKRFVKSFKNRIEYMHDLDYLKGGFDKLPEEALDSLNRVLFEIEKIQ